MWCPSSRTARVPERALRRRGVFTSDEADEADETDTRCDASEARLAASAVSGQTPPAGPQWLRSLLPLEPRALGYDKPLCASLDRGGGEPTDVPTRSKSRGPPYCKSKLLSTLVTPQYGQDPLCGHFFVFWNRRVD